jgi:radical SAM protein with 4Fe4S-binding SPASM domain
MVTKIDPELRLPVVQTGPSELYLEVTNRCNLACKTCPQYFGMPEKAADLTLDTVERLLDAAPDVKRVVLHGIGEPLLNRDLPAIVRAVKARGAYALFNTNGLLLRGRLVEPLIECGLDELRVSVDSADPHTYEAIRGIDGLERIFDNLRAFQAVKERLGADKPVVSLWITGMKTNVSELPDLVRKAAELGIGEVYLQRLVYSERGFATKDEALFHRADDPEVRAVAEAEAMARRLGITLRGSGEVSALSALTDEDADVPYQACRRPWSLMYVTSNGNVLPCCIAPFTGVPYSHITLGNVFETPLANVWNGERYQEWRRRMLSSHPPDACAGCGTNWSL